jgi:hypothetical protein
MSDFPHSLIEFQSRFPDEAACVRYLFAVRWPEGFVCPACGAGKAWPLQTADSDDIGRAFRLMSATCSERSRPAVPIDVGRGGGAPAGRM